MNYIEALVKMCYHKVMASKRYSKRSSKRTVIKLSPKEAEDIIKSEFTDHRKNKFDFIMKFKPHKPSEPTIKGTVEYKDEKEK